MIHFLQHKLFERDMVQYRFDSNSKIVGLLFDIRENIHLKFFRLRSDFNIESNCVEINLRKKKRFLNGLYTPSKSLLSNHLECIICSIDEYSKMCQNLLFWMTLMSPQMKSS